METSRRPKLQSLAHHGIIEGVTISHNGIDLCHYFGGVRYALPPTQRWRRARPLPASFSYGSKDRPGRCDGGAGLCPQLGFNPKTWNEDWNEEAWDEDCFQCNIWVPIGDVPRGGWPVFIFIHGGWLQFGTPNSFNAAALLGETEFQCVVVMPAYRVNLFGFLYSAELALDAASVEETVGNYGFWDQRLAMEWTRENIYLFGGNPGMITLAGYSAGGNSVFHQLAYDLRQPNTKSIIRQACIWSNGPAVQPKSPAETQTQFNQLLLALGIPHTHSAAEKIAHLRSTTPKQLLDAAKDIKIHQFRPTTDTSFIMPTLFTSLDDGSFAHKLLTRNIRIILGECADERYLYSIWYPPKTDTLSSLRERLLADYPEKIVDALILLHYPDNHLPENCTNWSSDAWGKIYAEMQVYHMQRGLIYALTFNKAGVDASGLLYRYRIEFRAGCADKTIPIEWGVTHSSDYPLWFWGNGDVLTPDEKRVTRDALIAPLSRFVRGPDTGVDGFGWGTCGFRQLRMLRSDGSVEIRGDDELWEKGVRVWKRLREVDCGGERVKL